MGVQRACQAHKVTQPVVKSEEILETTEVLHSALGLQGALWKQGHPRKEKPERNSPTHPTFLPPWGRQDNGPPKMSMSWAPMLSHTAKGILQMWLSSGPWDGEVTQVYPNRLSLIIQALEVQSLSRLWSEGAVTTEWSERRGIATSFEGGGRAMSQEMLGTSQIWKRQGNGAPLEPPERNAVLPASRFLPSETLWFPAHRKVGS